MGIFFKMLVLRLQGSMRPDILQSPVGTEAICPRTRPHRTRWGLLALRRGATLVTVPDHGSLLRQGAGPGLGILEESRPVALSTLQRSV